MNDPLKDLTPELIEGFELLLANNDPMEMADFLYQHGETILASMKAAIAYRREMDTMIRGRDEG